MSAHTRVCLQDLQASREIFPVWENYYKSTEKIKFINFLKCLYCCCFVKYCNAADHIHLV